MVFWHTAFKKHHSWLIRKGRGWNFLVVFMMFYSVWWFNRSSATRTFKYMDRVQPTQEKADAARRYYGYRHHYEPLIARSKKNYLIAQGDYSMRIPHEDQFKSEEALYGRR
mmetsp:Transcript_3490/g.5376  ORF Transcript_3490/g.5376 Transcript_3490/m.5376 type:complete len:111 (+) Transcript_3490:3-335(+)